MEQYIKHDYMIPPSACDYRGRLSYSGAFGLFMNLATEHAEILGVGLNAMKQRNQFWLTVKTRVVFFDCPAVSEKVDLRTWPEKPGIARCNRSYEIVREGNLLVSGRTEWAVINTETNEIIPAGKIFPQDMSFMPESAIGCRFVRINDNFEEVSPFAEYTVQSGDIDLGGHMNNAAYPRVLFNTFSIDELRRKRISCIDLIFKRPCFEGDHLTFYRKEDNGKTIYRMARGSETVLLGCITENS